MRAALAARAYRPRHALARGAARPRRDGAVPAHATRRGERVYLAMLARGYRGRMPRARRRCASARADAAFVAALALALRRRCGCWRA